MSNLFFLCPVNEYSYISVSMENTTQVVHVHGSVVCLCKYMHSGGLPAGNDHLLSF